MQDDDALVSACQSGDVNAFELLVRKYQDRTVRMLYLLLGNSDDAQDVTQETFLRAFKSIHTFRGSASFTTWLHRIAVNTARNWIRSNRPDRELVVAPDERWHGPLDRPENVLMKRERLLEIRSALAELPPHYRETIILRHFDELSYEEIADVQQVPVGTVRSRLAKGRTLLQRRLGSDRRSKNDERTDDNGLQEGKEPDSLRSRW
jgi:RNA polymerase sigma-70 factor (ECF subfamily)